MVKQEYVPIERPGTALCAGRTGKSNLPDYFGKSLEGILE
jgi:hypothetical protein